MNKPKEVRDNYGHLTQEYSDRFEIYSKSKRYDKLIFAAQNTTEYITLRVDDFNSFLRTLDRVITEYERVT